MARKFEVGKVYEPYQTEFESITVVRRTEKTIWVRNEQSNWRMRVHRDAVGNEYAVDNTVPSGWRDAFTYEA